MTPALLPLLLDSRMPAPSIDHVDAWWSHHRDLSARWPDSLDLAVAAGFQADRLAWAFASAYQAALHALIPNLPRDEVCALCVTEEGGTAPRAMQSTLRVHADGHLQLDGAKRWTTLGPNGGLFLVAARDARESLDPPRIRLARVAAGSTGLQILPMPPASFVPEIAHARLRFDGVCVRDSDLLPGDGYSRYVKPFRTVEDLHVHASALAYVLGHARRHDGSPEWIERALATLLTFGALSRLDSTEPATHLALAGTMAQAEDLIHTAEPFWSTSPIAAERWQRDRHLLQIAAAAREARREAAWRSACPC